MKRSGAGGGEAGPPGTTGALGVALNVYRAAAEKRRAALLLRGGRPSAGPTRLLGRYYEAQLELECGGARQIAPAQLPITKIRILF